MKTVSIKQVHEQINGILYEINLGDSLSDREMAIVRASFYKLIERLYKSSETISGIAKAGQKRELAIIGGGLTMRPADGAETCDLYGCSNPAAIRVCAEHYEPPVCPVCKQPYEGYGICINCAGDV